MGAGNDRNAPCRCGSGKKTKKCCGDLVVPIIRYPGVGFMPKMTAVPGGNPEVDEDAPVRGRPPRYPQYRCSGFGVCVYNENSGRSPEDCDTVPCRCGKATLI